MPRALSLWSVTKVGGESGSRGLHIKRKEKGINAVLPPQAGLFPSSCQRGHMALGLGRGFDRMGCGKWDSSQSPEGGMKHKNAPGGGGGGPAAQLIDILHVRMCMYAGLRWLWWLAEVLSGFGNVQHRGPYRGR